MVENLGVRTIEMKDKDGNIVFKAKDGDLVCKGGNFEKTLRHQETSSQEMKNLE